jgi:para-aminobenzoate synthetase
MKTLIIDNGTKSIEEIKALVSGEKTVLTPDSLNYLDINSFDLVILSGGSVHSAFDDVFFGKEKELIRKSTVPVLGICLGFEIITLAFGGMLKELEKEHKGLEKISVVAPDAIFSGIKSFTAYEHHHRSIDVLPQNFKILAMSGKEIAVIRHETLPIYGFQFHPEYTAEKNDGAKIFNGLLNTLFARKD